MQDRHRITTQTVRDVLTRAVPLPSSRSSQTAPLGVRTILKVQLFDAGKHELPDGVSLPRKDVPSLLAAIEARATHLLTGDLRHFGSYFGKRVEGILVLPPGEYLRRYGD